MPHWGTPRTRQLAGPKIRHCKKQLALDCHVGPNREEDAQEGRLPPSSMDPILGRAHGTRTLLVVKPLGPLGMPPLGCLLLLLPLFLTSTLCSASEWDRAHVEAGHMPLQAQVWASLAAEAAQAGKVSEAAEAAEASMLSGAAEVSEPRDPWEQPVFGGEYADPATERAVALQSSPSEGAMEGAMGEGAPLRDSFKCKAQGTQSQSTTSLAAAAQGGSATAAAAQGGSTTTAAQGTQSQSTTAEAQEDGESAPLAESLSSPGRAGSRGGVGPAVGTQSTSARAAMAVDPHGAKENTSTHGLVGSDSPDSASASSAKEQDGGSGASWQSSSSKKLPQKQRPRFHGTRTPEGPFWMRKCFGLGIPDYDGDAEHQVLEDKYRYPVCGAGNAITVSPRFTGVTWKGFGANIEGFAEPLGRMSESKRQCLVSLLFDKHNGLGLNLARYTIAGGARPGTPLWKQGHTGFHPKPWAWWGPPKSTYKGSYLWGADPYGRRMAKALVARRVRLEAIIYSPPWWMTRSRDSSGGNSPTNLQPIYFPSYAKYIADVLLYFQKQAHFRMVFDSISPFNEALEGWWSGDTGLTPQEGCNFSGEDIERLLPMIQKELTARGLANVKVSGLDSWIPYTRGALRGPNMQKFVKTVNVHGYRDPKVMSPETDEEWMATFRAQVMKLLKGAPIRMTEWYPKYFGPGNPTRPASQLDTALLMARFITQHVNILGVEAWYYWMAVSQWDSQNGVLRLDIEAPLSPCTKPMTNKQFYVLMHFTRSLPPGAMPLAMNNTCKHTVLGAYIWRRQQLTLTVTNQQKSGKYVWLSIAGFTYSDASQRFCPTRKIRTSAYEKYKMVAQSKMTLPQVVMVYAVPESVTTVIIDNIKPSPKK